MVFSLTHRKWCRVWHVWCLVCKYELNLKNKLHRVTWQISILWLAGLIGSDDALFPYEPMSGNTHTFTFTYTHSLIRAHTHIILHNKHKRRCLFEHVRMVCVMVWFSVIQYKNHYDCMKQTSDDDQSEFSCSHIRFYMISTEEFDLHLRDECLKLDSQKRQEALSVSDISVSH